MLGRMFKLCEFVFFFKTHTIKVDVIVVGNNMTDDRINDDRSFIWGVNYPFKLPICMRLLQACCASESIIF